MKMKRLLALCVAVCFAFSFASAEDSNGSVADEIGGWLGQAWEEASKWTSQAADDASKWAAQAADDVSSWAGTAWGDASEWIEKTWNGTSSWVTEIWGEVSGWASEKIDAARAWWTETYKTVTEKNGDVWEWIKKEKESFCAFLTQQYKEIKESAQSSLADAERAAVSRIYTELLKTLNQDDEDQSRIMRSIAAYAEEKGITDLVMEKIMLPYLTKLVFDREIAGDTSIPAVAVVQYLTGIAEKINIQSEGRAQELAAELDEALATGQ